jgi:serine/threonine protein kinase
VSFEPPLDANEFLAAMDGVYTSGDAVFVGGQAAVFRATALDGAIHAVKVYFPDPDAAVEERTAREVGALRRLQADTLVALQGDGHIVVRGTKCRYVATSFIDGVSVGAALKNGPLRLSTIARIGIDVADALALLWSERIVHRDVTPNNVMLTPAGRAVLIDLGLARHTALASLSKPNEGWGTLGYLSPEQAAGHRALTCKSDVFSLGVVLQQCALGRHPTNRDQRRLLSGAPPTCSLNADLPREFCSIVDAMLQTMASRRPSPVQIKTVLTPFATATSVAR